ncbi:hypothetical protein EON63_08745 [archaeon]|nr:MAG: hypothetical protein EON63_08745 [archaeon]
MCMVINNINTLFINSLFNTHTIQVLKHTIHQTAINFQHILYTMHHTPYILPLFFVGFLSTL